jgi:hypothetical protein
MLLLAHSERVTEHFFVKKLARIIYDDSHKVGEELARTLIEAAEKSVGSHHSEPYRLRIKYLCEDLDVLRRQDLFLPIGSGRAESGSSRYGGAFRFACKSLALA